MKKSKWTNEEIKFLKENYPDNGIEYCIEKLNRTASSTSNKIFRLKLNLNAKIKVDILKNSHVKEYSEYKINPAQFLKIETPEVAYFLGFLWADGYINDNNYTIKISSTKDDMQFLKKMFDKMGEWNIYNYETRSNWKDSSILLTNNYHIHAFLKKYDYIEKSIKSPDKILTKIPKKLKHYFFRGLIDGDGCFYVNEKQYLYQFSIASSFEQDWNAVENIFKKLGIDPYKINRRVHKNSKSSDIRITNKREIKKLGDYIYQNFEYDQIGLKRKYDIYKTIDGKC